MADKSVNDNAERLIVGKIKRSFGIKGWVKIESYTRPSAALFDYPSCYLVAGDHWRKTRIVEYARQSNGLVARFETCTDRDQAELLCGREITIDRSQLPELTEGQYYWCELIGLQVVDTAERPLGRVSELLETGANDVMKIVQVQDDQLLERLVPYIPDVVVAVDLRRGLMTLDWDPDF